MNESKLNSKKYFLVRNSNSFEIWTAERQLGTSHPRDMRMRLQSASPRFVWVVKNSAGVTIQHVPSLKSVKRPSTRWNMLAIPVIRSTTGWMTTKFYNTKDEILERELHFML